MNEGAQVAPDPHVEMQRQCHINIAPILGCPNNHVRLLVIAVCCQVALCEVHQISLGLTPYDNKTNRRHGRNELKVSE